MMPPPDPVSYQNYGQPPAGRHGCLTAWLILLIVVNGFLALILPFAGVVAGAVLPRTSTLAIWVPAVLALANVAAAVGLLQYRKWGFWVFAGVTVIALIFNLSQNLGIGKAVMGLIGVAVLYALLNIGDENQKAWPRLR